MHAAEGKDRRGMTNDAAAPPPCEVVVLTALSIEFQAVIRHLQDVQEVVHPSGTIYHQGTFTGTYRIWRVAVAEIGMGGPKAATETERAINYFRPQITLFVGISGGLKDVKRGDVVAASKVYAYESGKVGRQFQPRPEVWRASYALEQRAQTEARGNEWLTRLDDSSPDTAPQVYVGALAAGEKVLASTQSDLFHLLKATYGDTLAVEMEGHGFLAAVHANQSVHALVIRGISDLVDDKAEADASGWQGIAARHAAAFAFQVLAKFTLPPSDRGPVKMPPVTLPPKAQTFVGREEEINWLLQQFTDDAGKTLGLCGPGGMGKTALAAEALRRFTAQPDWLVQFPGGIFYHSFYAVPSLARAIEELAHFLGEDAGPGPQQAALRALSRRRTLLVFDGVEELADAHALRQIGGNQVVLLLSRRRADMPDLAHYRDIGGLTQEQGIALLQSLAGPRASDHASAERLVEQVGGYPLALQLVGSYLFAQQEEVRDYLHWFEETGLTAIHFGTHRDQSVSVLLQRTYDVLAETEQQLWILLGLLAPASFPWELVQGILNLPEREVRQTLGSLVNLSVLRRPDQSYEVSHPLVHTFAKERLFSQVDAWSADHMPTWRERLLNTLLAHVAQSDPYDRADLTLWSPHVQPLLATTELPTPQRLSAARLFNDIGFYAHTQGKYAEAESLFQSALAIREQQLGLDHLGTAVSLNNLAALYADQGKYDQAEPLYQRALTIREQQLGLDHSDTAQSLNNLAALYADQGKYDLAEPLLQRALAIRQQVLGANHPSTASTLNNLARLYTDQSKYDQAEPLLQRALAICEQELGVSHSLTATSLNNLAFLYKRQGKYDQAEPFYERALAISEQVLGQDHPDTATSLNNLAMLYADQGKYDQAEPLLQRALAICEQQLGQGHPTTQTIRNSYVALLKKMGREL